jgi:enoyl-CoA hydratase/carnithine racemase
MTAVPTSFRLQVSETGVAVITLARPDTLNSLTFEVYRELRETFQAFDTDERVRSIVLTGEGRAFCSGGDQQAIIADLMQRDMAGLLAFTRVTGALIESMRACRRPIVASVHGIAVGAGAVIALAADFRIASDAAKFGFIFPRVGLCGADMGAAYLLPRIVGLGRASELLFLGDLIRAEAAERIGLVNQVTTVEGCLPAAMAWAERLANGPAFAHAMTKQMLESEYAMDLGTAIEAEAQAQAVCMMHADFRTAHEGWTKKEPFRFAGAKYPYRVGPA